VAWGVRVGGDFLSMDSLLELVDFKLEVGFLGPVEVLSLDVFLKLDGS
jgi:hypothetical protein